MTFLTVVKIISALVTFFFIVGIVYLLTKITLRDFFGVLLEQTSFDKVDPGKIDKDWQEVQKKLASHDSNTHKLAVVEADSMLDYVLKTIGYSGNSLGDRLKKSAYQFTDIDGIWKAHKLRNMIVHSTGMKVSKQQAAGAVKQFEKALLELEIF